MSQIAPVSTNLCEGGEATDRAARQVMGLCFLVLALAPVLFLPWTLDNFDFVKSSLIVVVALLIVGCMSGSEVIRQRIASVLSPRNLKSDWISLGILLLFLSGMASTFAAADPATAFWGEHQGQRGLLLLSAYTVLYFAARVCLTGRSAGAAMMTATMLAAWAVGAYGILQVLGHDFLAWGDRATFRSFWRPPSTLGHPIHAGSYLALASPWVLCFTWRSWQSGGIRKTWPWLSLCVVGLGVVIASCSRGAWLALGLGGGAWLLFQATRVRARLTRRRLALLAILCAVAALMVVFDPGNVVRSSFTRALDFSTLTSRQAIWHISWNIACDHPWFGVGPDLLHLTFPGYRTVAHWLAEWNTTPTHAHNEFLHTFATQGVFGLAALSIIVIGSVRAGMGALRNSADSAAASATLIASIAVLGLCFVTPGLAPLLIVQLALLSRTAAEPNSESAPAATPPSWSIPLAGGSLFSVVAVNALFGARTSFGEAALAIALICTPLAGAALVFARSRARLPQTTTTAKTNARLTWRAASAGLAIALLIYRFVVCPFTASCFANQAKRCLEMDALAAVEHLESAVGWQPQMVTAWERLGGAAQQAAESTESRKGRRELYERGAAAFQSAIARQPDCSLHRHNLGRLLGRMAIYGWADPRECFQMLDESIRLEPLNPLLYADATEAALALGESARAVKYLAAGRKDFAWYGPLAEQAGFLALRENRYREAAEHLAAAEELRSDPGMGNSSARYAGLCVAFFHLKNLDAVAYYAPKALMLAPEAMQVRNYFAQALEARQEWDEAESQYTAILRRHPDQEPVRKARDQVRRIRQQILERILARDRGLQVQPVSRRED